MTEIQAKYLTAVLYNLLSVAGRTAQIVDEEGGYQSIRNIDADAIVRKLQDFEYAEVLIRRGNAPVGRLILTMGITMEPEELINDYSDTNAIIEQAITKAKADVGLPTD